MDFTKLHWESDFSSIDFYNTDEKFIVGVYRVSECPKIIVHVHVEGEFIMDAYLDDPDEGIYVELPQYIVDRLL